MSPSLTTMALAVVADTVATANADLVIGTNEKEAIVCRPIKRSWPRKTRLFRQTKPVVFRRHDSQKQKLLFSFGPLRLNSVVFSNIFSRRQFPFFIVNVAIAPSLQA